MFKKPSVRDKENQRDQKGTTNANVGEGAAASVQLPAKNVCIDISMSLRICLIENKIRLWWKVKRVMECL